MFLGLPHLISGGPHHPIFCVTQMLIHDLFKAVANLLVISLTNSQKLPGPAYCPVYCMQDFATRGEKWSFCGCVVSMLFS